LQTWKQPHRVFDGKTKSPILWSRRIPIFVLAYILRGDVSLLLGWIRCKQIMTMVTEVVCLLYLRDDHLEEDLRPCQRGVDIQRPSSPTKIEIYTTIANPIKGIAIR
jgi:hypothetical protein